MPNGRCANHGGKSTGPPPGSRNALKHGLYSKALTAHERRLMATMDVGSIDDEIRLAKVKLYRAVEIQASIEENPNDPEDLRHFELA